MIANTSSEERAVFLLRSQSPPWLSLTVSIVLASQCFGGRVQTDLLRVRVTLIRPSDAHVSSVQHYPGLLIHQLHPKPLHDDVDRIIRGLGEAAKLEEMRKTFVGVLKLLVETNDFSVADWVPRAHGCCDIPKGPYHARFHNVQEDGGKLGFGPGGRKFLGRLVKVFVEKIARDFGVVEAGLDIARESKLERDDLINLDEEIPEPPAHFTLKRAHGRIMLRVPM